MDECLVIKYGIVAVRVCKDDPDKAELLHFCGYGSKPNQACFDSLWEELSTDPELGLVGDMDGVKLIEADQSLLEYYASELHDADTNVLRFEIDMTSRR